MKTRPQLLVLAGAAVLALGACATFGLRHHGVTIHEVFVEIHPGTNISAEDQKKLDRILRHYDTSLYKIRKTENGKVKTYGNLKDVLIDERLLAQVRQAGGVAYSALQIGTEAHPDHNINPDHNDHPEHNDHPDHNINPDHTSHPHQPEYPQHPDHTAYAVHHDHPEKIGSKICSELVRRVTPVLQKYSGVD